MNNSIIPQSISVRTSGLSVSSDHGPAGRPLRRAGLKLCLAVLILAGISQQGALAAEGRANSVDTTEREVYVVPFSHLDLYWGGTREECLARGNYIIAKAVKLAEANPDNRFLIEDEVFLANYVESHLGTAELESLKKLVKEGRIEIAPKWAGIFQGLPDGEIHARNMMYGKRYAQEVFGVDPQVANFCDLPDFTLQYPQILRQSRTPYMVMTRMGPADKSLFNWVAPDGSKALVWNSIKGYGWGRFLDFSTVSDEANVARLRKEIAEVSATTPGPLFMHCGFDLWSPSADLPATVAKFNAATPARLRISTATDFFHAAEKQTGLPELTGDIPPAWPNIPASIPHVWPEFIVATNTLLAAEKFAAINLSLGYSSYPQAEFESLWKKLIDAMDHNHDGQGGTIGDNRKIGYRQQALLRGGDILRDSLRNIAERVKIAVPHSAPIVVFNSLGWSRDDVVKSHLTLYGDVSPADIEAFRKGIRLVDELGNAVPFHCEQTSSNISQAIDLVFVAQQVPSLGYKTYYVLPGAGHSVSVSPAANVVLDKAADQNDPRRPSGISTMENPFLRVGVDNATGSVTLFDKVLNREVCRGIEVSALEERGGNYIGIEPLSGRTIPAVVDNIVLEENNAVRAVLKITTRIADIPITQRLILYQSLNRLEIENTVTWQTPRYLRVQQLFHPTDPKAEIKYGVPFGAGGTQDVLPMAVSHAGDEVSDESWKSSRHVHDWIAAGGLTITADHQLFRLNPGVIRAEMLRGTKFTSVKVVRGEDVGSMHYPPPGTYTFRYSLSSASGDWKESKAYRRGMNWNNPLIPISVVDTISAKTLPSTNSFCTVSQDSLVLSALKKSDLENTLLLRVYEIEGRDIDSTVQFLGHNQPITEVNLLEETLPNPSTPSLRGRPYQIKTTKLKLPAAGGPSPR